MLIVRHALTEGAGFLAEFLTKHHLRWELVRIDAGDKLPRNVQDYSGIALMGGPMSVNDDLPWVGQEIALIQSAIDNDIPVIGHCLGGQMMSKALGAKVGPNPVKEIGWWPLQVSAHSEAKKWFGGETSFLGFHWHGETFDLPSDASHLLASEHCLNQAWSMGKHLAMQCHIEMTEAMVKVWAEGGANELVESALSPAVESVAGMKSDLPARVNALNKMAEHVYSEWIKGLKH